MAAAGSSRGREGGRSVCGPGGRRRLPGISSAMGNSKRSNRTSPACGLGSRTAGVVSISRRPAGRRGSIARRTQGPSACNGADAMADPVYRAVDRHPVGSGGRHGALLGWPRGGPSGETPTMRTIRPSRRSILRARRSPASASHPMSSSLRSAGSCASACPTATSKNSSPSAASRSTMSASTAGAAVHATAGRRRSAMPPQRWRSLAGRRDLHEDRWPLALRLPSGRPVRSGHRRARLRPPDAMAAHRFFAQAISATKVTPMEVTTDQAPAYPAVLDDLLPAAWQRTERYGNHRVEADHSRLKARLGPMRGLNRIAAPGWSSRGMRWCRTLGVDTTSWRSRSP
jgi:hypothetical protein